MMRHILTTKENLQIAIEDATANGVEKLHFSILNPNTNEVIDIDNGTELDLAACNQIHNYGIVDKYTELFNILMYEAQAYYRKIGTEVLDEIVFSDVELRELQNMEDYISRCNLISSKRL